MIIETKASDILGRLQEIAERREKAKAERSDLFKERDALDEQIDECEDKEGEECQRLKASQYDVCRKIDRLRILVKFFDDQIGSIITRSAKGDHDFMDDPIDAPDSLFTKKRDEKAGPPKDVPAVGEIPDASKGEGVDEHLNASPSELDIPDRLARDCILAGYDTIGKIARAMDNDEPLAITEDDEKIEQVRRAVKKYRKTHRKAMMEAEGLQVGG